MLFGRHKIDCNVQLIIDNIEIERIQEIKFLGVILDNKVNWKPQVRYIQAKLAKCSAILWKIKHILDYKSLHTISLIIFAISYLLCRSLGKHLQKHSAADMHNTEKSRTINKTGYRDHTNPLFIKPHVEIYGSGQIQNGTNDEMMRNNLLPKNIQGMCQGLEYTGHRCRVEFNAKVFINMHRWRISRQSKQRGCETPKALSSITMFEESAAMKITNKTLSTLGGKHKGL